MLHACGGLVEHRHEDNQKAREPRQIHCGWTAVGFALFLPADSEGGTYRGDIT
jgi:hypothetical protein